MASDEAIRRMFDVFAEIWPRDDDRVSDLTIAVYARCLADVPDDLLSAATVRVVSEGIYYPKPAEIRQAALGLVDPEAPSGVEAWGALCRYIRRWPGGGGYFDGEQHVDPPPLPQRIQRAVDAIGGLAYVRYSEDTVADRARFVQVYEVMERRRREEARMLPEVREAIRRALPGRMQSAGRVPAGAGHVE